MEKSRRMKLLWLIPLIAAILFALFWGIWFLKTGSEPITDHLRWNEKTVIHLPFAVSRFWDILFAPIWAFLFVFLFTNKRFIEEKNSGFGVFFYLAIGLFAGLGTSLGAGLVFGLGILMKFIFSPKTKSRTA